MASILLTIKKMLNLAGMDSSFDVDIIVHINTAFMALNQLGIGPVAAFSIVDETAKWTDFLSGAEIAGVKTYIYLKVRLAFDPPASSVLTEAIKTQITELEFRMNIIAEPREPEQIIEENHV